MEGWEFRFQLILAQVMVPATIKKDWRHNERIVRPQHKYTRCIFLIF